MTKLSKILLAVSLAGFAAGGIIDFGGFKVIPAVTVALPLGAVFFGLALISYMMEKEMAKFDEEAAGKQELVECKTGESATAQKFEHKFVHDLDLIQLRFHKGGMTTELPPPSPHANKTARAPDSLFSAFGFPRQFMGNRFVYAVVSPRARGLSIGVNINPDRLCNFDCEYCEVNRAAPALEKSLDVDVMVEELQRTLALALSGEVEKLHFFGGTPSDLLKLRHVTLSGDGEPTLCPDFLEAVRAVVHVRARGQFPFFKIVLVTNASGLDLRQVQDGLQLFTQRDEIWAKLDAGTQDYMNAVNHPDCTLEKILENILLVARQRPVIIQSLFPLLDDKEPHAEEFFQYAQRLNDLKRAGAQIPLVQIYSATRPSAHSKCGHLPLKALARIAQYVHEVSGLKTEVF